MKTYNFPNNGVTITPDNIEWSAAGFSKAGTVTLDINLINESTTFSVQLTQEGTATDRSDEAIDGLMLLMLQPYEV